MVMQIEEFLEKLINIPSITRDEYAIVDFLHEHLSILEMSVRRLPVDKERANLYASFGEAPSLLLSTHCDTVPPFIPARFEGNAISGRGACDAKGILAAMVYALLSLPLSIREKVGLLIVVGEETDSIGAQTAVKSGFHARYVINGEPTGNHLVRAQKGTFIFELIAKGKAAHSAYPKLGDSAISKLLEQLTILQELDWGKNRNLGEATLNIGTLRGGQAPNVIPDSAEAECCIRLVTNSEIAQSILEKHLVQDIEYKIISNSNPVEFFVPEGMESIVVPFGSDAAYLSQMGEILMLGPGDIQKAHTPEESIEIDALHEAVEMYQKVISKLLD